MAVWVLILSTKSTNHDKSTREYFWSLYRYGNSGRCTSPLRREKGIQAASNPSILASSNSATNGQSQGSVEVQCLIRPL